MSITSKIGVLTLLGVATISTLITTNATAQDSSSTITLEEIIVAARKREERLQEVPLSITAITDSELDAKGIASLEDIGDSTPGLDFAQAFGRQDFRPAIRGQSNILGRANAGLFVDGIIVEEGGATFPLNALERVEVVKGPQSALYGRSTLAGAINYVLKKPGDEAAGSVVAEVAERGYLKLDAHVSGPITDNFGAALTLSRYEKDGEYDNVFAGNAFAPAFTNEVGGEESNSAALVLSFTPSDKLSISGHILYDKSDDEQFAIAVQDPGLNNCFRPGTDLDAAGNVLAQPSPPAGSPEESANSIDSAAYNSSGYFCGEVTTENALGNDNATSLETSFFDDSGNEITSVRFGIKADYELSDAWTLTGIFGYNDVDTESRSDSTFGSGDTRFPVVGVFSPFNVQAAGFGTATPVVQTRVGFIVGNDDTFEDSSQEIRFSFNDGGNTRYMVGLYHYASEESGTQVTSFDTPAATNDDGVPVFNGIPVFAAFSPVGTAMISTSAFYEGAPFDFQGETEIESMSVFGSVNHQFNDNWSLDVEFRYNKDEIDFTRGDGSPTVSADFDAFLPKITFSNQASDDTLYYLTVGRGNKPGGVNDDDGIPASDVAIEEETAISYELGLKTTGLDGRLIANAAIYHIDWEDLQLTQTRAAVVGGQNRTFSILDNVGKATVDGLELSLSLQATDFWNVNLGYAYTDSNIEEFINSVDAGADAGSSFREAALIFGYQPDGNVNITGTQLPQTSKHQINFSNTFTGAINDQWKWYARADVNYNSKRYAQVYNLAHTGARTIVNARIGARTDTLEVELWATNLLDDNTPTALIRYVVANDLTFNPFNRAIGATLTDTQRFGLTARYNF